MTLIDGIEMMPEVFWMVHGLIPKPIGEDFYRLWKHSFLQPQFKRKVTACAMKNGSKKAVREKKDLPLPNLNSQIPKRMKGEKEAPEERVGKKASSMVFSSGKEMKGSVH
jgi:hypothetical protein